jgi:hypothetical protein
LTKTKTIFGFLFTIFYFAILTSCTDKKQNGSTKKSNVKPFDTKNEFAYLDNINDPNYLVSLLDNSNDLESSRIGIEGKKSQSYPIYERLCAIATDTTLLRLTKHSNPKIRVYSMWALTNKNRQLALTQMKLLKNDQTSVVYHSGCITMTEKVCLLIASKFDSSEVLLKPKKDTHYLDYDIVIK